MKFRHLIFLIALISFPKLSLANELNETLLAIQKHYESVETFSAKFTQKAYVKMLGKSQTSEGTVLIKKPGKMRWVYKNPDPQLIVSNNKMLWFYAPEEGQVAQIPMDDVYSSNAPALFLSGKGKIAESFSATKIDEKNDEIILTLVPLEVDHSLTQLLLYANNKSFQITGASVYDKLGNRTEIRFKDIQINLEIPEKTFQFIKPPEAEWLDFTTTP